MKTKLILNSNKSSILVLLSLATLILGFNSAQALANSNPTINGVPSLKAKVGSVFSFSPAAQDSDGDPLTFSIINKPAWLSFNPNTGELSGTPGVADIGLTQTGYIISVSDGKGGSAKLAAYNLKVLADAVATNMPPVIGGVPTMKIKVGTPFNFTPTASDANNDPLTFSITNKPVWANFNTNTGSLTGTPATSDAGSSPQSYVISVADGKGGSASLAAFNISVIANTPPVISGNPPATVIVGAGYNFVPVVSDQDGDILSFSIVNKPAWADFDPLTGTLKGKPSGQYTGITSAIVISVNDGKDGGANLAPFSIAVEPSLADELPVVSVRPLGCI